MAYYDTTWYCNFGNGTTTGYYAVTVRPQNAAVAAGQLCRQFTTPAVNSERVFVCIIAGTTANVTDATWVLTRGAKTVDGTATWMEVSGIAAVNGDKTNTVNWTQAKAIGTPTLGTIIQRNNGASYWICTTAGALGASEPAWANDTAGTTQADSTTTWTCLGVVGNFTGGQAPHARLQNVCTTNWFAAGNSCYVGDNHAESQTTAITIAPAGSISTIDKIICHNHSGSYPPGASDLRTTATISTTAAASITINAGGAMGYYFYGLQFLLGVGTSGFTQFLSTSNLAFLFYDACLFKLASTGSSNTININAFAAAGFQIWNNCTVYFGHALNYISIGDVFWTWQNTGPILASGSVVPTNGLLNPPSNGCISNVTLEALDLSQITTSLTTASTETKILLVKDCKLNAGMTVAVPNAPGQTVQFVRSDSAATAYKSTRYAYEGAETTETSIVRTGGSVDPTGQAQSRKIVTTANSQWLRPFKAEPYAIWNSTVGSSVTVTVCGVTGAGGLPNNDDVWLECEYLGSSASPLGTIVTTTKSNVLAANAAVASDSSSWGGGVTAFKLATTITPQLPGYIHARVRAAKASATYYIDPKVTLT